MNSAYAILIIPLPNLAKPPAFQKIIDAYEKSSETKAVALAAEDKTFGSRQWVMGHFSGNVSQEEANGRAMSSCLQSLAQAKATVAGGTPVYDFGNKTCELYKFQNEKIAPASNFNSNSADDCKVYTRGVCVERVPKPLSNPPLPQSETKVKNASESKNSALADSKILIDLPAGWIVKDIPENIKISNPEMYACNLSIGGCFIFWSYPENQIYSLLEYVNTNRKSHIPTVTLSEISLSDVEVMELYGSASYRYTMTGLLNKTFKYTYQNTFFKLGNRYVKLTLWVPENRYSDLKEIINRLANSFNDVANINSTTQKNENKNIDDLSNLPVPMN